MSAGHSRGSGASIGILVAVFASLVMALTDQAWAAQSSISVSGATGAPGSNITLAISLTNGGSTSPAAVQWDLDYSASDLSLAPGAYYSSAVAGKSATCGTISVGDVRCVVAGLDTTAIGSGVLATITFKIAPSTTNTSTQVSLVSPEAADGSSNALTIGGSGGTVTITPKVTGVPSALSVLPSSGSGLAQNFTLQYSDTAGAASLQTVWVYISATLANPASNSCLLYYNVAANRISLIQDSGTAWLAAMPGAATILQNSQCSLNVAGTSVVLNGDMLTLNLSMTFAPAYAGAKNVNMYAADLSGTNSGWQQQGTWTVPASSGIPATVSATPNSGSGLSQTFTLQYSDTAGAASLQTVWVYFSATLANPASNSCLLYYNVAANQISLIQNSGSAWLAATPGAATTLQNSQCSLNVAGTSVVLSGNMLTLNLAMTFLPAYAGAQNINMYAADLSGSNSGWQQQGTWTVPSGSATPSIVSVTPNSGSVASQTFALQYSDTAGAASLQTVWVYFSATLANPATNTCLLYYNVTANEISLLQDNGATWLTAPPGAATVLQNGQCKLNMAGTSVTLNGSTLTLNLPMIFRPAYAGAQNIYMYAADGSGANSGWQQGGTWTVP